MARTRTRQVILDNAQITELERIGKSRTEEARRVQRAKILLMAGRGFSDNNIAAAVKLNRNSVRNTIAKFHSHGVEAALSDLARPGRPVLIGDDARAWVASLACTKPKDLGYAQELWTSRSLTSHIQRHCTQTGYPALAKVSSSKVWSILEENDLKPWRIRYYLEKRDGDFDGKMREILLVYKAVELELAGEKGNTVTVSFDEKPGIQTIANTAPDLPPCLGNGAVGRDYEYKRLGTVSLLAGLDLITGEVTALVRDTHKSSDFIDFLKAADTKYETAKKIRIVLGPVE